MKKNIGEGDTQNEKSREHGKEEMGKKIKGVKRRKNPSLKTQKIQKREVSIKRKNMKTGLERDDRGKQLYFYICFLFKVGLY